MMKALLAERFGLKAHMEDRPIPAYTLSSVVPKLQYRRPGQSYALRGRTWTGWQKTHA